MTNKELQEQELHPIQIDGVGEVWTDVKQEEERYCKKCGSRFSRAHRIMGCRKKKDVI